MNIFSPTPDIQTDSDVLVDVLERADSTWRVMVYNDEYNTFEHVINQFMLHCKHTETQAAQCALIIHHVGKCSVKEGNKQDMAKITTMLCSQGIDARLEEQEADDEK